MTIKKQDFLAHWISEYPNAAIFITHPRLIQWFRTHPCPSTKRELDEEWNQLVRSLHE